MVVQAGADLWGPLEPNAFLQGQLQACAERLVSVGLSQVACGFAGPRPAGVLLAASWSTCNCGGPQFFDVTVSIILGPGIAMTTAEQLEVSPA